MIGIRFHGRGGQGGVLASKILAQAFFRQGSYVQAFPAFGMERRGAAVAAYVRKSSAPILERGEVKDPAMVIVLDPSLLKTVDVTQGLQEEGTVLVNHPQRPEDVGLRGNFRVATVDASRIALKHGLGSRLSPIVNTVILGAYARLASDLDLAHLLSAIGEKVPVKAEVNVKAAEEAFHNVQRSGSDANGK